MSIDNNTVNDKIDHLVQIDENDGLSKLVAAIAEDQAIRDLLNEQDINDEDVIQQFRTAHFTAKDALLNGKDHLSVHLSEIKKIDDDETPESSKGFMAVYKVKGVSTNLTKKADIIVEQ